jgi:predicted RNA-binding Zn ribbon-like protein
MLSTPAKGYTGDMTATAADLVLVEEFLNTLDQRTFSWHGRKFVPGDELTSPQALSAWLQEHDLAAGDREPGPSDLTAALALRTALRQALAEDADGTATAQALARFPLHLAPDPAGRLRITATSGTAGLDAIVETVATRVADGGWKRLKLCASPDCRRAFYDTSRNGTGRWCTMEACGNRHKTRAYRDRLAQQ